jgi:protein TonB
MRRVLIISAAALLTSTGVQVRAQTFEHQDASALPNPPDSAVIKKPKWVSLPSGDDMAFAYPDQALDKGVRAHVVALCQVTIDGKLDTCRVQEEQPSGYGFGAATLQVMTKFRMSPKLPDGSAAAGRWVSVPFNWTQCSHRGGSVSCR